MLTAHLVNVRNAESTLRFRLLPHDQFTNLGATPSMPPLQACLQCHELAALAQHTPLLEGTPAAAACWAPQTLRLHAVVYESWVTKNQTTREVIIHPCCVGHMKQATLEKARPLGRCTMVPHHGQVAGLANSGCRAQQAALRGCTWMLDLLCAVRGASRRAPARARSTSTAPQHGHQGLPAAWQVGFWKADAWEPAWGAALVEHFQACEANTTSAACRAPVVQGVTPTSNVRWTWRRTPAHMLQHEAWRNTTLGTRSAH